MLKAVDPGLVCPECGGALTEGGSKLSCDKCSMKWPVRKGTPIMTQNPAYFSWIPLSQANYDLLMERSQQIGWRPAVESIACTLNKNSAPRLRRFTEDESRADWNLLLPIEKDWDVLDLGAGWGPISVALSRHCKSVMSMDLCYERANFLHVRADQDGLNNIKTICGGNTKRIPFLDSRFDLVIMNGVLEWTPTSRAGAPLTIQKEVLNEVCRVLKPNGYLYLAIENRFGYPYLMGKPDNHSRLRYGNVLPRPVANLYSKLLKGTGFRTYTHSYGGLKKLLRQTGFSETTFYWAYPAYSKLDLMTPLDNRQAVEWAVNQIFFGIGERKRTLEEKMLRFMARRNLAKYFVREYSIVARKGQEA